ncbi:MAG: hypothetical protein IJ325_04385 [Clostridia bacterium]|nr:hypothetical protein [Clostridia bacterium]
MKKCKKCGTVQNDDRSTCVDCGAVLGSPMTEKETELHKAELDDKLEGMAERTEDFYVPPRDKVMGILCIFGVIAAVVLLILCGTAQKGIPGEIPDDVMFSGGHSHEYHFQQARLNTIDTVQILSLLGLTILIFAGIMLLFPKFMWQLSTLRYRLFHGWDTTPSDFALFLRKTAAYILFVLGMGCVIVAYWVYLPSLFVT